MKTLVVYDITDDGVRLKVSEACKNFGLSRIQRSTFIGSLPGYRRRELSATLKKILGDAEGNIQIFPICNADLALREVIGKEFKEEELDEAFIV